MGKIATLADKSAVEAEMPIAQRWTARTLHAQLAETARDFPDRAAMTFQLEADPGARAITFTWNDFRQEVNRAANLFRRLGVGPQDVVASILPNGLEAPVVMIAGATAGVISPINPLLSPEQIASILRETGAKVVVTLAPFPRSDVAQKVAEAVADAPGVETIVQVDFKRYLSAPKSWIVPFVRPRIRRRQTAELVPYRSALDRENGEALDFELSGDNRFCAYFHTGGTTGMPKIARHRASGMLFNGWCGRAYIFTEKDVMFCPLPLFHVFAAYPVFMSCLMTGAHLVMVTPQGYRGIGVMRNFWKLIAHYRVSFIIMVPTAAGALMVRKPDGDVSSLRFAICGSAAMPRELFGRFEEATGVKILEGYGMTEATCLISINPPDGERKIGSVGLPFPYNEVRILDCDSEGNVRRECDPDEVGEICVAGPGVNPGLTYTEEAKNDGLFADTRFLRTGDLGRIDRDGYIWITGRSKDLIIRGGHNIDPATIEEAMLRHPDVIFCGAIGQPDAHSGEVVAAYVELHPESRATPETLLHHARTEIGERAAVPRHIEVLDELPKTAVGKIFKPQLRRLAITRVFDEALAREDLDARVERVVEDKQLGLLAIIAPRTSREEDKVANALAPFVTPWRWHSDHGA